MKKNAPKILFILHLPPPIHGAAMVGKYIHDSRLINKEFECQYINLALAKELNDIGKGGIKKIKEFIQKIKLIKKTVKEFTPDLCYVTPNAKGGAFYKDFIIVQFLKLMGCKVIAHYHNKGVSLRQNVFLDNLLYKFFFKEIKIILLAETLYDDIKKYVARNSLYICPNGIPENPKDTHLKSINLNSQEDIPHLLFLSNLLIDKGVFTLLDACKIVKEKGYNFVCNFVGGETAELNAITFNKELAIRGLDNNVKYLGKKIGEEKEKCFLEADIFILPTYNECFPLVLLEAMQHSLPCIASNEGGIPDIIENEKTGFIIEKRNSKILAEKIILLLNNKKLSKQMGENGRIKFLQEFTLKKFENNLIEILKDCISIEE